MFAFPARKSPFIIPLLCLLLIFSLASSAECQSSWSPIGPEGGDVLDIIVDSLETQTVYIAVAANGIYRSQNAGALWAFFGTGLPDANVNDMALERKVTPGIIFAATEGAGAFRRILPGTTWQQVNTGLLSMFVDEVVVDPDIPNSVYAGASGGVFKSINAGLSWFDISGLSDELTGANVTALDVAPTSGAIFAAATGRGVFRSDDDGDSWTTINTGLPTPTLLSFTSLVVNPTAPDTVLLGTEDDGVFITLDGGGTWAAFDDGLLSGGDPVVNIRDFAIDTTNTFFLAATEEGVFRRGFAGPSWEQLSSGLSARFTEAIAFNPITPDMLFAGTSGLGVFKSSDGGATWFLSNDGIFATRIRDLVFNPNNGEIIHAACFGAGVFTSRDGGATWDTSSSDIIDLFGVSIAIAPRDPDTLFFGTEGDGLFRSLDEGSEWDPFDTGLPANSTVPTVLVDPRSSSTLFCVVSGSGVFKRVLPASWTAFNTGISGDVQDIAISPSDSDILLAVTDGNGVFRTEDGGATWTAANTGLGSERFFSSVTFDPANASNAFIGGDGAIVFKSTDAGLTWASAGTGLPADPIVNDIIVADGAPFSALEGDGVFRESTEEEWSSFSDSLTNLSVNALAVNPDDPSEILAATEGGGIFTIQTEDGDGDGDGGGGPSSLCFIATAAFGTPSAREVVLLREFRDKHLLHNPVGTAFVKSYYLISPPIARFISARPVVRQLVRALLKPVVITCAAYMRYPSSAGKFFLLLAFVSVAALPLWRWAKRTNRFTKPHIK